MRGDTGFPVRLRFTKRGKVRFIGHRDVARAFERAFRIEQLPLAFTLGFSPRPKVSFGLALSVGHESDAEYLDFELADAVEPDRLPLSLSAALPEGIEVTGAAALHERAPALQEAVTAVTYRVETVGAAGHSITESEVSTLVDTAMARASLETTRTRKGREVVEDIRPTVRRLSVCGCDAAGVLLDLEVFTQPRGTRPSEVLHAIGNGQLVEWRVLRTHQWIERDGARLEPLEADTRSPAPIRADERALHDVRPS
jgi:radical SAM-linked protein